MSKQNRMTNVAQVFFNWCRQSTVNAQVRIGQRYSCLVYKFSLYDFHFNVAVIA